MMAFLNFRTIDNVNYEPPSGTRVLSTRRGLVAAPLRHLYKNHGTIESITVYARYLSLFNFGFAIVKFKDGRFCEVRIAPGKYDYWKLILLPDPIKLDEHIPEQFPPPAKNSSSNILNALNDDCLREIFARMPLNEMGTVINVCKRFRDVADPVISSRLKNSEPYIIDYTSTNKYDWSRTLVQAEVFFKYFNDKIKSIDIRCNTFSNDEFLGEFYRLTSFILMHTLCYKEQIKIEELKFTRVTVPFEWYRVLWKIFATIKHLQLTYSEVGNLILSCSNVITINFEHIREILITAFLKIDTPHLQKVKICCSNFKPQNAFNGMVIKPTVTSLDIKGTTCSLNIFALICARFPNLIKLKGNFTYDDEFPDLLKNALKPMKHLRKFGLRYPDQFSMHKIVETFANMKMPIEWLEIQGEHIDECVVQSILKLKQIRILKVNIDNIKKDFVINLLNDLPHLINLDINVDNFESLRAIKETFPYVPIRKIPIFNPKIQSFHIGKVSELKEFIDILKETNIKFIGGIKFSYPKNNLAYLTSKYISGTVSLWLNKSDILQLSNDFGMRYCNDDDEVFFAFGKCF